MVHEVANGSCLCGWAILNILYYLLSEKAQQTSKHPYKFWELSFFPQIPLCLVENSHGKEPNIILSGYIIISRKSLYRTNAFGEEQLINSYSHQNVNRNSQPLWRTVWKFFKKKKKLKKELTYDPVIPLLGIYPEKIICRKDTCTPMFVAALFTIAKTWKKPKYLSANE